MKNEAFEYLFKTTLNHICVPTEGNKKKGEGCFNALNEYGQEPTEKACRECWMKALYGESRPDNWISVEDKEKLAEYAHNQWSGRMEYLFSKGITNTDGTWKMPRWAVKRWKRQLKTSYTELPEEEKESDRSEAQGMIDVLVSPPEVTKCPKE